MGDIAGDAAIAAADTAALGATLGVAGVPGKDPPTEREGAKPCHGRGGKPGESSKGVKVWVSPSQSITTKWQIHVTRPAVKFVRSQLDSSQQRLHHHQMATLEKSPPQPCPELTVGHETPAEPFCRGRPAVGGGSALPFDVLDLAVGREQLERRRLARTDQMLRPV